MEEHMENWESTPRPTVCLVEEDNHCYYDGKRFAIYRPNFPSNYNAYVYFNGVLVRDQQWPKILEQEKDELDNRTFTISTNYYDIYSIEVKMGTETIINGSWGGALNRSVTFTIPHITGNITIGLTLSLT